MEKYPIPEAPEQHSFEYTFDKLVDEYLAVPIEEGKYPYFHLQKEYISGHEEIIGLHVGHVGSYDEWKTVSAHPARLMNQLLNFASSSQEMWTVADKINSEEYKKKNEEYVDTLGPVRSKAADTALRQNFCDAIARNTVRYPLQIEELKLQLSARLSSEPSAEFTKSLLPHMEKSFTKRLLKSDAYTRAKIAEVFKPLEEANLLIDEMEPRSILSSPKMLIEKPYAEMMLHRMNNRSKEELVRYERGYINLGKLLFKEILDRYQLDPDRHGNNIEAIRRHLAPDSRRPDVLSRNAVIRLSNTITSQLNEQKGEQKPLLDEHQVGVVSTAMERLLAITSANDATSNKLEEHRKTDKLYADLFGSLLEPRYVADKNKEKENDSKMDTK